VDNCSNKPVEEGLELSWHPASRVIREYKLGLTYARLRGIREARGGLLIFVDDDNVLDSDYLSRAVEISADCPHLGAWSGNCRGEFEVQPEEWARKYLGPLCVFEFDRDYWCNFPFQNLAMPCGAGLCLRANAARQYLGVHERGLRPIILDRRGNSLLSGGDVDIALTCAQNGYGIGVFKRLYLTHLIPSARVTRPYLLELTEALGFTGEVIEFYHPSPRIRYASARRKQVADFLRGVLLPSTDRQFFRATQRGQRAGQKAVAELKRLAARGATTPSNEQES
jgi:glycosyltransferase involved in cell wall biosynthesis